MADIQSGRMSVHCRAHIGANFNGQSTYWQVLGGKRKQRTQRKHREASETQDQTISQSYISYIPKL